VTRAWALRLAAYLLVIGMFVFALWQIEQLRLHDRAQTCVNGWEGREQTRDMNEKTYRRNAETLLSFASGSDPARLAAYRAQVERDVVEIRATLPNPSCDLDAAKRRL